MSVLLDEWKQDSKFDLDLGEEALRVPNLHSKYLGLSADVNRNLKRKKRERARMITFLKKYYRGDFNNEEDLENIGREPFLHKLSASGIVEAAETDADIREIDEEIDNLEYRKDVLDGIMKSIYSRGFDIKHAIEWRKLEFGH